MTPPLLPLPDLAGAFGDIVWAAYVPDEAPKDGPCMTVLALESDHELVTHRLLLAGYTQQTESQSGSSVWSRYDGALLTVFEAPPTWGLEAIAAATRNRDARGAPHLTAAYAFFLRLHQAHPHDGDEARALALAATPEVLREVGEILTRLDPEPGRFNPFNRHTYGGD